MGQLNALARDARRGGLAWPRGPQPLRPGRGGGQEVRARVGAAAVLLRPLGLLYAAPLQIALPAVAAWVLACTIIPKFVLIYFKGALSPLFAVAGVLHALGHNLAGERLTIFGRDADGKPRPRLLRR